MFVERAMYGPGLRQAVHGVRKRNSRAVGGSVQATVFLTEPQAITALWLMDELGQTEAIMLEIISWDFLLRVQSAGIPLQKGARRG